MDCAKQLIKTGGIASLYRGLGATFVRSCPQAGLYFMTYEILKKAFAPVDGSSLTPIRTMTAGGLTGIINWVFMLPADVVKSRIQTGIVCRIPALITFSILNTFRLQLRKELIQKVFGTLFLDC